MAEPDGKMPVVKVYLDLTTGKLWFKTPEKGARWHKGLANIDAVMKAVKLPRPIEIDYIDEEELNAG